MISGAVRDSPATGKPPAPTNPQPLYVHAGFFGEILRAGCWAEGSGRAHRAPLLEALPAEDRAALRRAEGDRGFLAALRAVSPGLRPHGSRRTSACGFRPLGLTCFTALGFVLETFIGEEHLFAACENEFGATLRALQHLVMVFHEPLSPRPETGQGRAWRTRGRIWNSRDTRATGLDPWA